MFCKDKPLASALRNILGFYPRNLDVYRIALAHKSAKFRPRRGQRFERPLNNERLEYLGDAILEAVTSDILYHKYPRQGEGFLTSTRAKLVQRSMLNRLADEMGLDKLINKSLVASTHNVNIGGNAFEALVGAVYLDRGYRYCQWFVGHRIIGSLLDVDTVARKEINFKSKLLEWSQKNRIQMTYSDTQIDKPGSNSAEFVSIALLEGVKAGRGTGFSKKESQQNAAKEALINMRASQTFYESIFHAKEQRTAMEESEICVLPRIQEIEDAVQQRFAAQAKDGQRRPAARRERPANDEPRAAKAAETAEPKREAKREAKKGEPKTAEPKAAQTKTAEPKTSEPKREAKEQPKREPKAAEPKVTEPKREAKAAEPKREAKEQPKREAKAAQKQEEPAEKPAAPAEKPIEVAPAEVAPVKVAAVPVDTTAEVAPAIETPAEVAPAETPAEAAPVAETPVEAAPVEVAPAVETPAEAAPAEQSADVATVEAVVADAPADSADAPVAKAKPRRRRKPKAAAPAQDAAPAEAPAAEVPAADTPASESPSAEAQAAAPAKPKRRRSGRRAPGKSQTPTPEPEA